MGIEEAFMAGLSQFREDLAKKGLPEDKMPRGNSVEVLAAYRVFERACSGKVGHESFDDQAPKYAYRLIATAYAM